MRPVSGDCTFSETSQASPTSEGCHTCAKDGYVNGEVGCSADITCASTDESHSCRCNRNKLNCEPSECEKSRVLRKSCDAAVSQGRPTERSPECKPCATTHHDCAQHRNADSSRNGHHFVSQVQSQKLTNGTDESCSVTTDRSDSCKAVELNAKAVSDDAASETAKLCKSSVDTSCVSESTRQNILDAAETFASIIGREIAASFDLKEGELSPPECQGDADGSFPMTHCSATSTAGHSNSTRTLHAGLKLLRDDRKCESDKGPPLDTLEVARRVRDILTANNVGQRQFARCVLGLSQGTVSELLAKPKPWDRLTEKGKESYRRMNQWAGDHLGVLSLKDHRNSVALKATLLFPKGSNSYIFCF